jgi:aryl-alcohol dehydrogenase-like predicted oxidoreductase
MNKRVLGNTGLQVSELALGGLFVSSVGGEFEQSRAAILRSLELGVNYIDTAPGYANSEEVIGAALEGVDAPFILSTKLGGRPQPFNPQDKACLRQSVEESLRLLKRDTIDILMIHEPDVAVVAGSIGDYADAHPTTAVLVIEVADTSLAFDRTAKASLYAKAGIPEYWMLNLAVRCLAVSRDPRPDASQPYGFGYATQFTVEASGSVSPLALPEAVIQVADMLP